MTDTRQGSQRDRASTGEGERLAAADLDLADRYAANRLSDTERDLVETRIVGDARFRNEVELTEALRDGLRHLHEQGEVGPLLASRSALWRRPSFALAASVIAGLLAIGCILLFGRLADSERALTAATDRIALTTLRQATGTASLRFERLRNGQQGPDVAWSGAAAPTLIKLRFDVGMDPATGYTVLIEKIDAGAEATLLNLPLVGVADDGEVSITIHSALLSPGNYRIRLEPLPSADLQREPTVYALRVEG